MTIPAATRDGGTPERPRMDPASGFRRAGFAPHDLHDAVTPEEGVFTIAHLGLPRVDPARWSLTIDGLVSEARTLNLDALKALPKRTIEAVHECCGSPLEPTVPTRRVANVRWGGADLATLLGACGIAARAQFLWACGLDGGVFAGTPCAWYVKDVPLTRLAAGDVLVAYEMNDAPLTLEHGFPARLVVPGYYGTNSVKWLWRLQLADTRADGLFARRLYNDVVEAGHGEPPRLRPVRDIAPESVIVAPSPDAVVMAGKPAGLWGWAWSARRVDAVEVSIDGGASFVRASLEARRGWAWQRFMLAWQPRERGEVEICARAIDADGASQPEVGARNAMHRVRVLVR